MTKTISLPETVYEDLVSISDELTIIAKKPISISMAIDLLTEVYRAYMNNACTRDTFSQQLERSEILSPEEFDRIWDDAPPKKEKPKNKTK
jgi:hypothetical protein